MLGARSEDKLAELASELGGRARAIAVRCDVTEFADNEALAAAANEAFGGFDAVFANAGFGAQRGFLEESPEHWRTWCSPTCSASRSRSAPPSRHCSSATRGHYVITSSVAGRRALPGSLYSATKWAVTAIGEALRQELRSMHDNHAIRVTLIEPGMVDTPFFDNRPGPDHALHDDDIAPRCSTRSASPSASTSTRS